MKVKYIYKVRGLLPIILAVISLMFIGLPTFSYGESGAIEPKADTILRQMSDYLASLQQFSVKTENTIEVILRSGQKVQFVNPAECSVWRPNKLQANRKGDIVDQEFYYDGKKLTLYSADQNWYATVEAPQTLDETLDFATDSLDVEAPAADLLYRDAYKVLTEDTISGFYVGMSVLGGTKCHHLAFQGNEVDWQIWIEDGDKPLPRRFIVTTKFMTGAPQFTVSITNWNVSPNLKEEIFTFTPPKDAQKVDFIRAVGASQK